MFRDLYHEFIGAIVETYNSAVTCSLITINYFISQQFNTPNSKMVTHFLASAKMYPEVGIQFM